MGEHGPDDDRRRRLLAMLDGVEGPQALPGLRQRLDRVCVVTASEVGVDGAGVTVMGSAEAALAGHRDQLAATGALARRLEDLQLTVGEGPCLDAHASGTPVLAGDVASATSRWPGFGPEALVVGAAALFSLPLQVGAVRLGTLDLHRQHPGPLSREQLADALSLAALATEVLLELAEPAGDEGDGVDPPPWRSAGWLPDVHADVHVASGMVAAREGGDVGTALLRIRAHAFASGEAISDVARSIVERHLVLDGRQDNTETHDHQGPSVPDPEQDD